MCNYHFELPFLDGHYYTKQIKKKITTSYFPRPFVSEIFCSMLFRSICYTQQKWEWANPKRFVPINLLSNTFFFLLLRTKCEFVAVCVCTNKRVLNMKWMRMYECIHMYLACACQSVRQSVSLCMCVWSILWVCVCAFHLWYEHIFSSEIHFDNVDVCTEIVGVAHTYSPIEQRTKAIEAIWCECICMTLTIRTTKNVLVCLNNVQPFIYLLWTTSMIILYEYKNEQIKSSLWYASKV